MVCMHATILALTMSVSMASTCPSGDAFCQASYGPNSYCRTWDFVCQGSVPAATCSCGTTGVTTAKPVTGTTVKPAATTTKGVSGSTAKTSTLTTKLATGLTTVKSGTTTTTTVKSGTTTTVAPSGVTTKTATSGGSVVSGGCGSSTQSAFIWGEWPTFATNDQAAQYYAKLLSFSSGNCAKLAVNKLIVRVNDPNFRDGLWQVSTSSVFYTAFLSKVPAGVSVHILPYLQESFSQQAWMSATGASTALEGVFKYVSQWNKLAGGKIAGVVVDGEEGAGFNNAIGSVPSFKSTYGVSKFGMAVGFDGIGRMLLNQAYCDDYYVEMYDFWSSSVSGTIDASGYVNNPAGYWSYLKSTVMGTYMSKYDASRVHFMWSNQFKAYNCIYPLGSVGCGGGNNDFGVWSANGFNSWLSYIKSQEPLFASRPHGLFQFSFMPTSWM